MTAATHRSHDWIAADDVLECANCMSRSYNKEAKSPCPRDPENDDNDPTSVFAEFGPDNGGTK